MSAPRLGMIWAQASDGVIGVDGVMPWHIPEDMAHFKSVTMGYPVIMGRRTWESLPERFRPLDGRRNIVVTRQIGWTPDGAEVAHDLDAALALVSSPSLALPQQGAAAPVEAAPVDAWIIGGGSVYAALLDRASVLEVTEVAGDYAGDTHAPAIDADWHLDAETPWTDSRSGPRFRFLRYRR
jgi:dihydrofolate reductase